MSVTGDMLDENSAHGFEAGVAYERAKVIAWLRKESARSGASAYAFGWAAKLIEEGVHNSSLQEKKG